MEDYMDKKVEIDLVLDINIDELLNSPQELDVNPDEPVEVNIYDYLVRSLVNYIIKNGIFDLVHDEVVTWEEDLSKEQIDKYIDELQKDVLLSLNDNSFIFKKCYVEYNRFHVKFDIDLEYTYMRLNF